MITATCHCGAARLEAARRPRSITNCNCSICRRYGVLWAYDRGRDARVVANPGATESYSWGRKALRFVRCRGCGNLLNWERIDGARIGINARLFEPEVLGPVKVRLLDGAAWPAD